MNRREKKVARRKARQANRVRQQARDRAAKNRALREARCLEMRPLPAGLAHASLDDALAALDPLNNYHGHHGHG